MNRTISESLIFPDPAVAYLQSKNIQDLTAFMEYVVSNANRSDLANATNVPGSSVDLWIQLANLMLNTDLSPSLITQLAAQGLDHETILAKSSNKIDLIKLVKEKTGSNLATAKEAVNAIVATPLPNIEKTVVETESTDSVATTREVKVQRKIAAEPTKEVVIEKDKTSLKKATRVTQDARTELKKEDVIEKNNASTSRVSSGRDIPSATEIKSTEDIINERIAEIRKTSPNEADKIEKKLTPERIADLDRYLRSKGSVRFFTRFRDPTEKAEHTLKPIENVQFEVREPLNTIQTTDGRKVYLPDVNTMDLELMIMETELKSLRQQPRSDGSTSPIDALLYALQAEKEHRDDAEYNKDNQTEDLLQDVYRHVENYNRNIPEQGADPEIGRASRDQIKDILQRVLRELAYRGYLVLADSEFDDDETNDISMFKDPTTEFFDELRNAIDDVRIADEFLVGEIKGKFVYEKPGTDWPIRNATVTISWNGHNDVSVAKSVITTDQDGAFCCSVPTDHIISTFDLKLVKAQASQRFSFTMEELREKKGDLGTVIADSVFGAYEGLLETLDNLTDNLNSIADLEEDEELMEGVQRPAKITFGNGGTEFVLEADDSPSEFSYRILHRLVEPSIRKYAGGRYIDVQRQQIGNPIDLSIFRETSSSDPSAQPLMATLGIGYILSMQQVWKPTGFYLGDMLYSTALAPGEEQRIVMSEKSEMYKVMDVESLSDSESESYRSNQKNSLESIFTSSLLESINGSTHMESKTKSAGTGLIASLFAASNKSTHTASSSSQQSGRRDETSMMAESFNEKISRKASNQRASSRTGIRTASSSESTEVTSKIIANHNHSHALTMQYWEVVRNYSISTHISDVNLVCYVPFQPISFLPKGEDHILAFNDAKLRAKKDEGTLTSDYVQNLIKTRYSMLMKYFDAIYWSMPYKYRKGLTTLKKYATCPLWEFSTGNNSTTTLMLSLRGGFLSIHDVHALLRLKNGRTIKARPVTLVEEENHSCISRAELVKFLKDNKQRMQTLNFEIDVPPGVIDDDYHSVEYYFNYSDKAYFRLELNFVDHILLDVMESTPLESRFDTIRNHIDNKDIKLNNLEMSAIGVPTVQSVNLYNPADDKQYIYSFGNRELNKRLSNRIYNDVPTMTYEELQQIEATFQHVIENTIYYSQGVWRSLGPEERAMMLERFTIAMPRSAGTDVGANVPLMDCVTNQILGFYGNCMIMPFAYPAEMADVLGTSSKALQDALYRYHTKAFRVPDTSISLGTDGMIGEAILGKSNASEKIDITRFWNWNDSPITHATDISTDDLDKTSILSGKVAPSDLVNMASDFTLDNIAATKMPDLIQYLSKEKRAAMNLTNSKNVATHMTKIAEANANERINTMNASADLANGALEAFTGVASKEIEEKKKKEEEDNKSPETKEAEASIKKTKEETAVLTEQLNKAKAEAELAAQQLKKVQQEAQIAKAAKGEETESTSEAKGKGKGKEEESEEPKKEGS